MKKLVSTALLLGLAALPSPAAELRVPADFARIGDAVAAAGEGDVVLVAPGDYVVEEPIVLRRRVTLRSERGPSSTSIRMSDLPLDVERASVIEIRGTRLAAPVLDGFRVAGGQGSLELWLQCGGLDCVGYHTRNGGGILCGEGAAPEIRNCIITRNSATYGGGVFCHRSSPRFTNCVIAGNGGREGASVFGGFESAASFDNCTIVATEEAQWGFFAGGPPGRPMFLNCIFIVTNSGVAMGACSHCEWGDPADLFLDPDPDFADYHLRPGSKAIDSGALEGAPATDIEGHGRPCGQGVDLGAYEMGDCPVSGERFVRGDANLDGAVDLADLPAILDYLFLGGSPLACPKSGDLDDSARIEVTDAVLLVVHLFLGGNPPREPFPGCGIDPTLDELSCDRFTPCGR